MKLFAAKIYEDQKAGSSADNRCFKGVNSLPMKPYITLFKMYDAMTNGTDGRFGPVVDAEFDE
jgi:hypothetical protein